MDINSLLSPSEGTRAVTPQPGTPASAETVSPQSPRKNIARVQSGPLKSVKAISPGPKSLSGIPQHILSPRHTPTTSSPLTSPSAAISSNASAANGAHSHPGRTTSNQSMDTLADLASMQSHQPLRSTPPGLRSRESYESQLSPSTIFPTVPAVSITSNPRSSFDIAMAEAPKHNVRVDFASTSLPLELQQSAQKYSEYLQTNPSSYQSHVALINILHHGFVSHVYPPDSPQDRGDPRTYDLLDDLRSSRENMDKLFAVGEDLWADWIQDESMLAQTVEEQVEVMEKCRKAVGEEYSSTKLWAMCGDWMLHCYRSAHEPQPKGQQGALSEEDQMVGRELFTWISVRDTWRQAAEQTSLRLNDSHLIWDRYIQLLVDEMRRLGAKELRASIQDLFQQRLRIPHANWDSTFQAFSTFISEHEPQDYENIMASTNRSAADAKRRWRARELMETRLQSAQQSEEKATEYIAFGEYISWERNPEKDKCQEYDLINTLYQRAELRFPSTPELWEDHYLWLIDESQQKPEAARAGIPLALLDRATRHCPWSGSLWSEYLIQSESQGQSFQQTQEIKNKATNTGLLDVGGMEEVLRFHKIWCSYLRRQAYRPGSSDEEMDVAEMGIRSSIENVQELATKQGLSQSFDPLFRLERLYIGFLSKKGSWDSAREVWRGLITNHGDSSEFWLKYYSWEMVCYSTFVHPIRIGKDGLSTDTPGPHYATALLKDALRRPTLDWPEKIMETLLAHCEDHEDVEELQIAMVEMKKLEKAVAIRRENEKLAAAMADAQTEHLKEEAIQVAEVQAADHQSAKRKRDEEIDEPKKRNRTEAIDRLFESSSETTKELERDRENATILVQNLPEEATETKIRQFFRECGTVNNLKISREKGVVAVIEFDEKEAAQFALSRDGKEFLGSEISVQIGTGSVLFVANYPPTADKSYIRSLFDKFGTVLDIRFPSLIHNTHRRFCYVHFELAAQAKAATELDGSVIEKGKKLVAKISDPSHRQNRSGPIEENREIFIKNVHWGATESDIKDLFQKYGSVQSTRIPRNVQNKSKGFAYAVFETPQDAKAALEADGIDYRGRTIHVEISKKPGVKRQATTIVSRLEHSRSPSAGPDGDSGTPSAKSIKSLQKTEGTAADRRDRTIALMNVPHTVNDARIKALAETCGTLVKISLRPDHQGAIIEYVDSRDAAKATLQLDGHEIDPGRKLQVGSVPEMLKNKAEVTKDRIALGKSKEIGSKSIPNGSLTLAPVKRPGQPGLRKGGGLGQKRGLGFRSAAPTNSADGEAEGDQDGKSNDDFRAMLKK